MKTRTAGPSALTDNILEQARTLPIDALNTLNEQLGDHIRFETQRVQLVAALSAAQISEDRVKLIECSEDAANFACREITCGGGATFEITPASGGDVQTLMVYYDYHCESAITTYIHVDYGSPARHGSGCLRKNDMKGYSGSCSSGDFRKVFEAVALDLEKITELSSAGDEDARKQLTAKFEAKNGARGFPEWTPKEQELIKVMEAFVPNDILYKEACGLSILDIVMWGVGSDSEEYSWSH